MYLSYLMHCCLSYLKTESANQTIYLLLGACLGYQQTA